MQSTISFILDNKLQSLSFNETLQPTTTVLNFLRNHPLHKGVKEGCAEGDCGACTVVITELDQNNKLQYKAIDSCLVFLPMLHGKQLITVESLSATGTLHPVQQAMVDSHGSQCGYCTPGFIMSMFALYKTEQNPSKEIIEDTLTGNLCRCTGYKPIIEAMAKACVSSPPDSNTSEKQTVEMLLKIKTNSPSLEITTVSQKYYQPKTLKEALVLRKNMPNSVMISGATDVALRVTKKHEVLNEIIDLSNIAELKKHSITNDTITFGSGLSLEEVKTISKNSFPALHEALTVFGSKQIRTLATLGGNLGSGSPIGDTLPVLMAYNAAIKLQSTEGERTVNMNKYILGYRQTARQPNEIITSISIPKPQANTTVKFYKVSKRKDLDISTVCAGFSITLEKSDGNTKKPKVHSITLAYGGMAATTKRASAAESFLLNKDWTRANIEQAMELIASEFSPISDARSGAAFRTLAAKNLLLKFWNEL